ncbi:myosin heavy chain non-muscle [Anaeramoeba flamelloides]|uniref:Myosin heavy chain non-muscle n=1 Tax=Anaeramoeba flamelloides TaxID=1746091 RepID=A0AAV8A7E7_9EUKA|nr:myosin heavy chain non-muscle [Anaeramoeba flamelloides]
MNSNYLNKSFFSEQNRDGENNQSNLSRDVLEQIRIIVDKSIGKQYDQYKENDEKFQQIQVLKNKICELEETINRISDENTKYCKDISKKELTIKENRDTISSQEKTNVQCRNTIMELNTKIENLKTTIKDYEMELKGFQKDFDNFSNGIDRINTSNQKEIEGTIQTIRNLISENVLDLQKKELSYNNEFIETIKEKFKTLHKYIFQWYIKYEQDVKELNRNHLQEKQNIKKIISEKKKKRQNFISLETEKLNQKYGPTIKEIEEKYQTEIDHKKENYRKELDKLKKIANREKQESIKDIKKNYSLKIMDYQSKIEKYDIEINKKRNEIQENKDKIQQLSHNYQEKSNNITNNFSDKIHKIENDIESSKKHYSNLIQTKKKIEEQISPKAPKKKINKSKQVIKKLQQRLKEVDNQIKKGNKEIILSLKGNLKNLRSQKKIELKECEEKFIQEKTNLQTQIMEKEISKLEKQQKVFRESIDKIEKILVPQEILKLEQEYKQKFNIPNKNQEEKLIKLKKDNNYNQNEKHNFQKKTDERTEKKKLDLETLEEKNNTPIKRLNSTFTNFEKQKNKEKKQEIYIINWKKQKKIDQIKENQEIITINQEIEELKQQLSEKKKKYFLDLEKQKKDLKLKVTNKEKFIINNILVKNNYKHQNKKDMIKHKNSHIQSFKEDVQKIIKLNLDLEKKISQQIQKSHELIYNKANDHKILIDKKIKKKISNKRSITSQQKKETIDPLLEQSYLDLKNSWNLLVQVDPIANFENFKMKIKAPLIRIRKHLDLNKIGIMSMEFIKKIEFEFENYKMGILDSLKIDEKMEKEYIHRFIKRVIFDFFANKFTKELIEKFVISFLNNYDYNLKNIYDFYKNFINNFGIQTINFIAEKEFKKNFKIEELEKWDINKLIKNLTLLKKMIQCESFLLINQTRHKYLEEIEKLGKGIQLYKLLNTYFSKIMEYAIIIISDWRFKFSYKDSIQNNTIIENKKYPILQINSNNELALPIFKNKKKKKKNKNLTTNTFGSIVFPIIANSLTSESLSKYLYI